MLNVKLILDEIACAIHTHVDRRASSKFIVAVGILYSLMILDPGLASTAYAQDVDVLHVGQALPHFNLLTSGERHYLRYTVVGDKRATVDIWSRNTSYEMKDGKRLLHITQRWDSVVDKAYTLKQDAWFEAGTFRPLTEVKELTRDGKVQTAGYRFLPDKIVGMTELEGNSRKDFNAPSSEPAYNFETDMELLQTLPLAANYEASIVFYDPGPGADAPRRYIYKVVGSDKIVDADDQAIDCWIVTTEEADPKVTVRWWYAKHSQVMVREEAHLADGSVLVKTLLTGESS